MKNYNLKLVNEEENIEPNKAVYELVAVVLLEYFIENKIKNNKLLEMESK